MSYLNIKNRAKSTLAANMLVTDLSLTVATGDGVKFPATSFNITIIDEILFCSSRSGDILTVVRAQEGTTASAHTLGDEVDLRITAGIIENLERGVGRINAEVLAGDKTLTPGIDPMYQYLNNGKNFYSVILATSTAKSGDRFIIYNISPDADFLYSLLVKQGTTTLDSTYPNTIKTFIFDGTNWIGADNGTFYSTGLSAGTSIGYNANGSNGGVAIGKSSNGHSFGAAVGRNANGSSLGASIGFFSKGYTNGAALGYYANGSSNGVAVGYNANGAYNGAAVGYNAGAGTTGVAVGYNANGSSYGASIGSATQSAGYGVAVGYSSKGSNNGTAIGAYSQGEYNGVSIGYKAGSSISGLVTTNKNVLIGYQAGMNLTIAPAWIASTAYVLNDYIRPSTANTFNYECTIAGTSGATEPTWNTVLGGTTTDGTITWTTVSVRDNNNIFIGYNLNGTVHDADKLNIGNTLFGDILVGSAGVGTVAALPTADVSHRGHFLRVEGGAGVKDVLYICEKNTSDIYVWTAIT